MVIFCLSKFRLYVLSSIPFILITDHQTFLYVFSKKDFYGLIARWLDFLAVYDFNLDYRAKFWRSVNKFMVWDGKCFRHTNLDPCLVAPQPNIPCTLK